MYNKDNRKPGTEQTILLKERFFLRNINDITKKHGHKNLSDAQNDTYVPIELYTEQTFAKNIIKQGMKDYPEFYEFLNTLDYRIELVKTIDCFSNRMNAIAIIFHNDDDALLFKLAYG